MTFELDTLIAIAFIAPMVFFVVLNVVAFRTRGYEMAVKPAAPEAPSAEVGLVSAVAVNAVAANDSELREAA